MTEPTRSSSSRDTIHQRDQRVRALRPYAAVGFILLGLVPVGVELVNYWTRRVPISGGVIAIGGVFGFIGAYMMDHQDTKDAAAFIVTNGIAIVNAIPSAIRGGRRSTDPVVVPPSTTDTLPRGTTPNGEHPGEGG